MLARLLVLALASGVAVTCVEVGLRVAGIGYPRLFERDPVLGVRMRPGVSGRWTSEGDAFVKANSLGFRDHEHAMDKPPGVIRIAVLGDSYVEALQVDVDEAFPAVVERSLSSCDTPAGDRVEVLRFGGSGYGTAEELLALRHHALRFSPDIVLVAVLPGNDIRNNSKPLSERAGDAGNRPFFVRRDGELVIDDSFRDTIVAQEGGVRGFLRGAIDRSNVLQVVNRMREVLPALFAARREATEQAQVVVAEVGLDNEIYFPPTHPDWREAWAITEGLLAMLAEEARAVGALPLLVTLSNGIQVHPDPSVRQQYAEERRIADLDRPDEKVVEIARRIDVPVLRLAPVLRGHAETSGVYLHGFENTALGGGHWNEAGHRLAGETIATWICNGTLDGRLTTAPRGNARRVTSASGEIAPAARHRLVHVRQRRGPHAHENRRRAHRVAWARRDGPSPNGSANAARRHGLRLAEAPRGRPPAR